MVKNYLTPRSLKAEELESEKGASSRLTLIPLKDLGVDLNKREFKDAQDVQPGNLRSPKDVCLR